MILGRLLLVTAVTAASLSAQDAGQTWRDLRTPDGSRFVLVPSQTMPVIHWVTSVPVGDLIDPPAYPGLSLAVIHASMSGTDTIGTDDWREERRLTADRRRVAARIADVEARGEEVPADLLKARARTERELAAIVDVDAWRRAVHAAPSLGIRVEELPEVALVSVTTEARGFASVARLLMDRRENAVLRTLDEAYARVTRERAAAARSLEARMRDEISDLAFFGLGTRTETTESAVSEDQARELFRRTHSPASTVHVITGGFDLDEMASFLERQFNVTSLPQATVRAPQARSSSRERLSTISGEARDALGIGIELDESLDRLELRVLAEWFAGGRTSFLAGQLRSAGILDADVRYALPFPLDARPGLLLVEVWGAMRESGARPPDLLGATRRALRQSVTREMVSRDLNTARQRTLFRAATELSDPAELARWLAIECGVRGVPLDQCIESTPPQIERGRFVELAQSVLVDAHRFIVLIEGLR